ncbi:MAG: sulfur relay protein DsrC [Gammaproteobacteria bacterium]|nr:sulfur relay protein DsrC [Gammaproteobacteria bacterium]NNJ85508.1 sulfur relay protein DsrC [Gammaproteobacteria bacterium]
MLHVSELLLQHHDLNSFKDLLRAVKQAARTERFFRIDVKPPFIDTPGNWEDQLESAFIGALDQKQQGTK